MDMNMAYVFGTIALVCLYFWWRAEKHETSIRFFTMFGVIVSGTVAVLWLYAMAFVFPPIQASIDEAQDARRAAEEAARETDVEDDEETLEDGEHLPD